MRRIALLVTLVLLGFGDDFSRNFYVRLDGFLGVSAESVKAWRELEIQLAGDGTLRKFALTQITVPFGETLGSSVLDAVQPLTPNFILAGSAEDLEKIRNAGPTDLLRITGNTSTGNQWILVNKVEIVPADQVEEALKGDPGATPGEGPPVTQRVRGFFAGC